MAVNRASADQGLDQTSIHRDGGTRLVQGPVLIHLATTLRPFCSLHQTCVFWMRVVGFARSSAGTRALAFWTAIAFETLLRLPPPERVTSGHRAVFAKQKTFHKQPHTLHAESPYIVGSLCVHVKWLPFPGYNTSRMLLSICVVLRTLFTELTSRTNWPPPTPTRVHQPLKN